MSKSTAATDARFMAEISRMLKCPASQALSGSIRGGVINITYGPKGELWIDGYPPGQYCMRCGCTHNNACVDARTGDSCAWVRPGLCTACETKAEREIRDRRRRRPGKRRKR